jgi:UDP-N-acetylmuramate dehydrogenase
MKFSYRSSLLKETDRFFLIRARFDLSQKIEKYHSEVDVHHFRNNQQPKGQSCGSFFKNPTGHIVTIDDKDTIILDDTTFNNAKT